MEAIDRCLLCGGARHSAARGGVRFRECSSCGYAVLAGPGGRPDYWSGADESAAEDDFWVDAKRRYFQSALALLEKLQGVGRLLDIGGGVGFFAQLALSRGWDAYSLDVSPKATALAASRIGSNRAFASLEEVEVEKFDVVSLWCVIAHTDDPVSLVEMAAHALRPGGVVWITTPNFDFQRPYAAMRAALRRPVDFAAEDHVGHFTPEALENLLLRGGFSELSFCHCGITETCILAQSRSPFFLAMKRSWNRLAFLSSRVGLPNYMSELQVVARRVPSSMTISNGS